MVYCSLLQQIPEHTEIPDLGISLVKLLQDFRVQVCVCVCVCCEVQMPCFCQVNLREGCKKILVKDR